MNQRPECPRCGACLEGPVNEAGITPCPKCGKRWRLNTDRTDIYDVTLDVHSVDHKMPVPRIGDNHNG